MITLATVALFSSCGAEDGNGNVITEVRNLRNFNRVHVTDGLTVNIVNGPQQVSITLDQDLQNNLVTDVDGDELKIRLAHNEDIAPTMLQIDVSVPSLQALVVKDHSSVTAVATQAEEWRLHVENESLARVTGITAQRFVAHITDQAFAEVSGSVIDSNIDLHDASTLEASGLTSNEVKIDISGGSQANVFASQRIEVDSAGDSRVTVTGNPPDKDIDADRGSQVVFSNQ